ncbi:MAG: hypothetical protein R2788_12005 [Saprospiraceae bacterium]
MYWLQIAWRTAIDRYRSRPRISQSLDDDYSFMQVAGSEATPEQQLQQQNTESVIQRASAK